jgi:hypothetical protein
MFFKGALLLGVGQRVARARHLLRVLEAHQIAPAQMVGDGPSQPLCHPGGNLLPRPVRVLGGRRSQCLAQLLLQRGRQDRWRAIGGRVSAVMHAVWSLLVVALGDLADPVRPIPGYRGQLSGGAALCQQPQQLPPRTLVGLFSATVAALEFVDAQMWLEVDVSGHAAILLPPTTIPYEWPVVL